MVDPPGRYLGSGGILSDQPPSRKATYQASGSGLRLAERSGVRRIGEE
jgi:hypothetical protein